MESDQIARFLPLGSDKDEALHIKAVTILQFLNRKVKSNAGNNVKDGLAALPAIASLLACEEAGNGIMNENSAQKSSPVKPQVFRATLQICRSLNALRTPAKASSALPASSSGFQVPDSAYHPQTATPSKQSTASSSRKGKERQNHTPIRSSPLKKQLPPADVSDDEGDVEATPTKKARVDKIRFEPPAEDDTRMYRRRGEKQLLDETEDTIEAELHKQKSAGYGMEAVNEVQKIRKRHTYIDRGLFTGERRWEKAFPRFQEWLEGQLSSSA